MGRLGWIVHNILSCIKSYLPDILNKYKNHIFQADHLKKGIMDLGKNQDEILKSISDKISKVNADDLLKEGSNQIRTTMNGVEAEIRVFVKDGEILSVDAFKGFSSRTIGNVINY